MLRRDFIRSMAAIGLWPFAKDIAPSPTPTIAWPAADDPHFWRWLRGQRHGIVIKKLPIGTPPTDPDSVVRVFADAITPRTRAIDVPHITSKLGIVLPVAQIAQLARGKNIFFFVDGAQAIGQRRID